MLRALAAAVIVCIAFALAAPAGAFAATGEAAAPAAGKAVAPAAGEAAAPVVDDIEVEKDGTVAGYGQRRGKGSGFWTSDVPTEDHPYRWTYMLIGLAVAGAMGLLLIWLIRKHGRKSAES